MHVVVYIGTGEERLYELAGFLIHPDTVAYMSQFTCPVTVYRGTARPAFPTEEQEMLLSSAGVRRDDCPECNYRMFIGGVSAPVDHRDGAELPPAVLDSYGEFRSQVLHRIRKAVGAPGDN